MFASFFIFNGKFCEHCDGVEVDFPLGPTLANVFIYHFENICRRFVDDTFLQRMMLKSLKIISANKIKTKFTLEIERNGLLSFLDITITRENNKFVSVYRKPTFSGVFTNFESFN